MGYGWRASVLPPRDRRANPASFCKMAWRHIAPWDQPIQDCMMWQFPAC
jgi:hypothetical protein